MRLPNARESLMGFLDGGGAALFASVLASVYLDASLYRPTGAGGDNGAGGGDDPALGAAEPVKVQMEAATDAMREAEGYQSTDVRFLMLAHGVTRPDSNCQLGLNGIRYGIRTPVGRDPAGAYWDIHARVIGEEGS
jgi:hypothetical protein